MLAGITLSISYTLDLPVEIKVIRDALRHYAGINAICHRIDLIDEALSVAQQKVLDVAVAAILYNHHQFTCNTHT